MYYEISDSFRLRLAVLAVTALLLWLPDTTPFAVWLAAGVSVAFGVLWLTPSVLGQSEGQLVSSAMMWFDLTFSWLMLLVLVGAYLLIRGTDGAWWSYAAAVVSIGFAFFVSLLLYGFMMLLEGESCEA